MTAISNTNINLKKPPEKFSPAGFVHSHNRYSISKDFPLNYNLYLPQKSNQQPLPQTANDSKKKAAKGITIIIGGVLLSTLALINRSAFRRLYKKSSEIYSELADKARSSEMAGQTKSVFSSVQTTLSRGIKKIGDIFKLSANAVAVRDSAVDKMLNKTPLGTKFANWTRRVFGQVATNELDRRYDHVERTMRHFSAEISDRAASKLAQGGDDLQRIITIKDKSKPLEEWLKELGSEIKLLKKSYEHGFSKDARIARDKVRNAAFADLPERQWNRIVKDGGIFNLKKYRNYITDELTAQTRAELSNDIALSRKIFTNNVSHEYKSIKGALREISDTLRMDDKESKACVDALKNAAERFKACHGKTEGADRQAVIKEIHQLIQNLSKTVSSNDKYPQDRLNLLMEQIEGLEFLAGKSGMNSQGILQRISTILNGLSHSNSDVLSEKEFGEIKKTIHSMTRQLNGATALETDDYFIKRAEIKIGSAPTDIFGLFGPVGIGTYAIARGKTKDEKVEAALTAAIPLIGGIGTYIFGTVRMFSASKNAIFSFLTGIGLNFLGRQAVKLYRAYQEKQSIVKIALDSYNSLLGKNSEEKIK